MIHLEGMGLLGSMVARRLAAVGRDFTWSDNDTGFTAWACSTGLAYPSGSARDQKGLARWRQLLPDVDEAAAVPYLFAHKHPPHGGRYPIVRDYGPMRRGSVDAVALNVPDFVESTRKAYDGARTDGPGDGDEVVVAHPTARTNGYLWGWAARVRFALPGWCDDLDDGATPALYAKAHRFNLTYAYPIPGTGQWWAGSTLTFQKTPSRAPTDRVNRLLGEWQSNARRLLGIVPADIEPPVQGWRPRSMPDDRGHVAYDRGRWTMPPMATDGMRRGPLVVDELMRRTGWDR